MSIRGKSEIMSRVLVDEMSRGGGIRVRKRRHAWHASNMQREITCFTCHSVFSSPFLPTLCARAGSIDASLVNREEAALRRLGGQIWSIKATCTVKKGSNDLRPHFHFSLFTFYLFIFSSRVGLKSFHLEQNGPDLITMAPFWAEKLKGI